MPIRLRQRAIPGSVTGEIHLVPARFGMSGPREQTAGYPALLTFRTIAFLLATLGLAILPACGGGFGTAGDYYVSAVGSDVTGDGSAAAPWASIQYALDHIDYRRDGIPQLHVAAGDYLGRVRIGERVAILGAGSDVVTLRSALPPRDHVVVITRGLVTLAGVTVDCGLNTYPGLLVTDALPIFRDVRVLDPWGYGIQMRNCAGFEMTDCYVGSDLDSLFDVGIDLDADAGRRTAGTITHFTNGGEIDHIINVLSNCNVIIRDCQLQGSSIHYADGVRVQGSSNVTILDTSILRSANADPATDEDRLLSNPAGVDVGMSAQRGALVTIDRCTITGFDTGVSVNMIGNRLLVQRCQIAGNVTAAVKTIRQPAFSDPPIVDFGGGTLGSLGANLFGATELWGFQHLATYDVSARFCDWSVPLAALPGRIYDLADDATVGTVSP